MDVEKVEESASEDSGQNKKEQSLDDPVQSESPVKDNINPVKGDNKATKNETNVVTSDGENKRNETSSAVENIDSSREEEDEDPSEEKFEDAVYAEDIPEITEPAATSDKESSSNVQLSQQSSSVDIQAASTDDDLSTLKVTESETYEIESSPEKSPSKEEMFASSTACPSTSSKASKQIFGSVQAATVVLDDVDDDDEGEEEADDDEEPEIVDGTVDKSEYDDDEEEDYDEDDYYEDPESDDQDVNRVIQGDDDVIALDDQESGEEDKMDVSSEEEDEEGYEEEDEEPSIVIGKREPASSDKKKSEYYELEEMYNDDDDDDDDEEEDYVEDMSDLDDEEEFGKANQGTVSMGQISIDDESEEDIPDKKKKANKVKYKTYRQKLIAKIRKRTYKLLNKRSMHVMEEGGDALVCSDATKIVSLKSTVSTVAKVDVEEAIVSKVVSSDVSSKDPKSKEPTIPSQPAKQNEATKPTQAAKPTQATEVLAEDSVDDVVTDSKKDDENKENMTVKDNTKLSPRRIEIEEKQKSKDDENSNKKDRVSTKDKTNDDVINDVMDDIDDIIEDAKYQNGSKAELNDELTFQMDVDDIEAENDDQDDDDEDCVEEHAVDLSSSESKQDKENDTKKTQKDDSDIIQLSDSSSPTKSIKSISVSKHRKSSVEVSKSNKDLQKPIRRSSDKSSDSGAEGDICTTQENAIETKVSVKKSSPMQEEKEVKEKPKEADVLVSRKRRRSMDTEELVDGEEPLVPSKKLKRELECNFQTHDLLLKEYIETTTNNTVDDVQKHTDALMVEIQTLNEMIRAKEVEWNNMIHLKKVKEEILLRLTRKKHVLDIMHTKLGEMSEFTHIDSANISDVRSASVGPRPPTPPPEVDIRPASVNPMHSSSITSSKTASINRQFGSSSRDNSLFAHFNSSNTSVTMVPLSTSPSLITSTNTILQSRANMKSAEVAKEKSNAVQIQRQILPKPVLSNHQQIMTNLAMSAGLTAQACTSSGATSISNAAPTATAATTLANNILAGLSAQAAALLNGHHNAASANHLQSGAVSQANQLQVGRQGVIKDVKSIIADYRQKHPEQVPRRGRRLKNIPNTGYDGTSVTITNKSGTASARMTELGFLLAAAENSRPSSNDSSQSNSNNHTTSPPAPAGFFLKDVLEQFAKMSQSDRNLLSNLNSLTNAAAIAAAVTSSATTNSASSSQQQHQSQQQQQQNAAANLTKGAYPEVTLHPVMNSNSGTGDTNSEVKYSATNNASSTNQSQSNSNSTNSLLHGILTKSSSRPNSTGFTSFSPTLARLLTAPERMNSQAATVTSGALANLQANTGLNLSKSNSEITITPVVASNLQQSLLAHQHLQEQQKQLQRLREQHFLNMDDEADDSVDRLVIDEGDDHHGASAGTRGDSHHREREPSVVITARGGNGREIHENEVPECQGCKKREAQFVCAGCGNQWYCSRECQVNAWDDHSEVCTG